MLHICNSNQENLTRATAYVCNAKRYFDPMDDDEAASCSPSKRAKLAETHTRGSRVTAPPVFKIPAEKQARSGKSSANNNENGGSGDIDQLKLFTYSQVLMICEQKLREQRERLKEEYERTLREKLAEQYDTFIKFRRDQIERERMMDRPSYLS